jgi:hypothetical protein
MPNLISVPREDPAFLLVSADDDPIVRKAKTIRDAESKPSQHAGFAKAIGAIHNNFQADLEKFHQNVLARLADANTQCGMMLSNFRMLENETEENAVGDTLGKVHFDLEQNVRTENVHTETTGRRLYQALSNANLAFEDFKHEHKLQRNPKQPQNLVITLAILIALVIAEIVLNGFFFMDLSKQGLFGGLFEAFLFAPFNVLAASVLGYYSLRHIRGLVKWKRRLAAASGVVLAGLVLFLNSYLAALRLSLKPDNIYDIPVLIKLIFSSRILDIMDYESLGILTLGYTLAIFAAWKAYNLKDPYPGYDEVNQARQNAEENIEDLRLDYLDDLSMHLDHAVENQRENRIEFLNEIANFQKLMVFIKDEQDRFNTNSAAAKKIYAERLHAFHRIYVLDETLATPELEKIMDDHELQTGNARITAALQEIPEGEIGHAMQIESRVRSHFDKLERKIHNHVTLAKENTNTLFEGIKARAKTI